MTKNKFKVFLRKSPGKSNAFVSHVWNKLREDAQYQIEEVQDWVAHIEYVESILLEFNTNNTPRKEKLGQTFYDVRKSLIQLWIVNIAEIMPWDNQIRAANKFEARAKIHGSIYLDQLCPKGTIPLKMSLNSWHNQAKKIKAIYPQIKASLPTCDQSEIIKKAKEKVKKETKEKDIRKNEIDKKDERIASS